MERVGRKIERGLNVEADKKHYESDVVASGNGTCLRRIIRTLFIFANS
jgi:hypothetical protein